MKHIMIDIETLGTNSYSIILSIGAVYFDIETGETGETFYVKIDPNDCSNYGLTHDESTMNWWRKQSKEAKDEAFSGKEKLPIALEKLNIFLKNGNSQMWGNSASFDLGLLNNAYQRTGIKANWKFYNERCVRTLVSFAPQIKQETPFEGVAHTPISDCLHQIKYCSKIWKKFTWVQ